MFKVDDNEKNKLKVVSSGRCGLEKMYKYLKDDEVGVAALPSGAQPRAIGRVVSTVVTNANYAPSADGIRRF